MKKLKELLHLKKYSSYTMLHANKHLSYTKEMQKQDVLWEEAKEDLDIMLILQKNIVEQAKQFGWNGYAITYKAVTDEPEIITDIFETKEDYDNQSEEYDSFGNCKALIKFLETKIKR